MTGDKAIIVLAKRKNSRQASELVRECCCQASGKLLCAVHSLAWLKNENAGGGHVFELTLHRVRSSLKTIAREAGVQDWSQTGTHSFRRGMAQDIIDTGCPLSVLLRAGGWTSSAYAEYLREGQGREAAVGQAIIALSDSEDDS